MPRKRDPDQTYGQKVIRLFATLLFSGTPRSLIELADELNCSKQTVMKIVDDITRSYSVPIEDFLEGRRKYYRIRPPKLTKGGVSVSADELAVLEMCRAFARHLLGGRFFEEAADAIGKTWVSLARGQKVAAGHFGDFLPGTIDYAPFYAIIRTLIEAMETRHICRITYQRIMADAPRTFYIKPMKLFSHKDTLYLHVGMARYPGRPYRAPDFDPLLPVHRIRKVAVTERQYRMPPGYDFEKVFNQSFGVIKGEAFRVTVDFDGWAARFVRERVWSPDQEIVDRKDGGTRLRFTAGSREEVMSWVLFFGDEARVVSPTWLAEAMAERIAAMARRYGQPANGA